MANSRLAIPLVALLAPLACEAAPPDAGRAWLVSFDELERILGEPSLRLLDARPKAGYDRGHIPGAIWVDAKAVEAMAAKPGALGDPSVWEGWIARLGIRPGSEVLVYDAQRQLGGTPWRPRWWSRSRPGRISEPERRHHPPLTSTAPSEMVEMGAISRREGMAGPGPQAGSAARALPGSPRVTPPRKPATSQGEGLGPRGPGAPKRRAPRRERARGGGVKRRSVRAGPGGIK